MCVVQAPSVAQSSVSCRCVFCQVPIDHVSHAVLPVVLLYSHEGETGGCISSVTDE